jgi:ParB family chromosome partitioning protein
MPKAKPEATTPAALVVETVAVESLVPYAKNAKRHEAGQVAAIAGSIREFGFCSPVLIDKDGGIIAGHGRVLAARQLGMTEVPAIRLGHLTETQRRAYVIADNRLSEIGGGWDADMLAIEIGDLRDLDFDLAGVGLGDFGSVFSVDEVSPPALADGDRAPFRQATFTLHDEQWEEVEAAIAKAKQAGGGESAVNENSNGNALAWICRAFYGGRNG